MWSCFHDVHVPLDPAWTSLPYGTPTASNQSIFRILRLAFESWLRLVSRLECTMERVLESPRRHRRECVGTIDRTRNWIWKHTAVYKERTKCTSIPCELDVGKPMANQTMYVLDSLLRETPEWCVGEICFGGAGFPKRRLV